MPIRIIVNGAEGKMGKITVTTIQNTPDFHLLAALNHQDDLASMIQKHKPDMVIDFTRADQAKKNTAVIIEHHCRPMIGTTGLSLEDVKAFQKICANKK